MFDVCLLLFFLQMNLLSTVIPSDQSTLATELELRYKEKASKGYVYAAHLTHVRKSPRKGTPPIRDLTEKGNGSGSSSDGEPPVKTSKLELEKSAPYAPAEKDDSGSPTKGTSPVHDLSEETKESKPSSDSDQTIEASKLELEESCPAVEEEDVEPSMKTIKLELEESAPEKMEISAPPTTSTLVVNLKSVAKPDDTERESPTSDQQSPSKDQHEKEKYQLEENKALISSEKSNDDESMSTKQREEITLQITVKDDESPKQDEIPKKKEPPPTLPKPKRKLTPTKTDENQVDGNQKVVEPDASPAKIVRFADQLDIQLIPKEDTQELTEDLESAEKNEPIKTSKTFILIPDFIPEDDIPEEKDESETDHEVDQSSQSLKAESEPMAVDSQTSPDHKSDDDIPDQGEDNNSDHEEDRSSPLLPAGDDDVTFFSLDPAEDFEHVSMEDEPTKEPEVEAWQILPEQTSLPNLENLEEKEQRPPVDEPELQQVKVAKVELAPLTISDEQFIPTPDPSKSNADERRPKMYGGTPTKVPISVLLDPVFEPMSPEKQKQLQEEEAERRPKFYSEISYEDPNFGFDENDNTPKPVDEPELQHEVIAPTELAPVFLDIDDKMKQDIVEEPEINREQLPSTELSLSVLADLDQEGEYDKQLVHPVLADLEKEYKMDEEIGSQDGREYTLEDAELDLLLITESGDELASVTEEKDQDETEKLEELMESVQEEKEDVETKKENLEEPVESVQEEKGDTKSEKEQDAAAEGDDAAEDDSAEPLFTTVLKDVFCFDGDPVLFTAKFDGIPVPKVSWFRDGEPIRNNEDFQITTDDTSSSLYIPDVIVEDSGEFVVKIENEAGSDVCKAFLEVEGIHTL